MSQPAIQVEGLWKEYVVGHARQPHGTFYDLLASGLKAPLRRLRQLGSAGDEANERFWALRDVNFAIQPGEVVGVIGRNGAGKSTLLKILSRITAPTRGRITVRGRLASLLEVGTGFHPELSGRENIFLNGAILGMSRAEVARKFDEIVAFAEVDKFIDTPVKRYSSGMYVRLAFAVAAHLESEILIIDEVLAVGDAGFQSKCLSKMNGIAEAGRTVLFVSHNMGAVSQLCSRALILGAGDLIADESVGQAIKTYMNIGTKKSKNNKFSRNIDPLKKVQFLEVIIIDENGRQIESATNSSSIYIRVRYYITDWPLGAYLCLDINNEAGQCLVWSCDVFSQNEMQIVRPNGEKVVTIEVPPNLLATGIHSMVIAAYAPGKGIVFDIVEDGLTIEIIDGGSMLSAFGNHGYALTSAKLRWIEES
mgnify:CR=1 FL=1|jgi:lipopolysaccharide transport system ATP-binding protein